MEENKTKAVPKVSVVMPVYNALPYLSGSIDAVLSQTLRDFELICVDDGSTDDSLRTLRAYAEKDTRVRVLTQKNLFAGAARNAGLAAARGEYLVFLDSDDLFEPDMLETMYRRCTEDDADVCICNTDIFDMKTQSFRRYSPLAKSDLPEKIPFAPGEYDRHLFTFVRPAAWNKMVRRSLTERYDLRFQTRRIGEDMYFSYCCCALAGRITYVPAVLMHLRRGLETNLESTLARTPTDFAEALWGVRDTLRRCGVFDALEKSFVSAAIAHSFYSVGVLSDKTVRMELLTALREKFFPELHICDREKDVYESCLTYAMLQWLLSPLAEEPSGGTAGKALFMAKACVRAYGLGASVKEWYKYARKNAQ